MNPKVGNLVVLLPLFLSASCAAVQRKPGGDERSGGDLQTAASNNVLGYSDPAHLSNGLYSGYPSVYSGTEGLGSVGPGYGGLGYTSALAGLGYNTASYTNGLGYNNIGLGYTNGVGYNNLGYTNGLGYNNIGYGGLGYNTGLGYNDGGYGGLGYSNRLGYNGIGGLGTIGTGYYGNIGYGSGLSGYGSGYTNIGSRYYGNSRLYRK